MNLFFYLSFNQVNTFDHTYFESFFATKFFSKLNAIPNKTEREQLLQHHYQTVAGCSMPLRLGVILPCFFVNTERNRQENHGKDQKTPTRWFTPIGRRELIVARQPLTTLRGHRSPPSVGPLPRAVRHPALLVSVVRRCRPFASVCRRRSFAAFLRAWRDGAQSPANVHRFALSAVRRRCLPIVRRSANPRASTRWFHLVLHIAVFCALSVWFCSRAPPHLLLLSRCFSFRRDFCVPALCLLLYRVCLLCPCDVCILCLLCCSLDSVPNQIHLVGYWHGSGTDRNILSQFRLERAQIDPLRRSRPKSPSCPKIPQHLIEHTPIPSLDYFRITFAYNNRVHSSVGVKISSTLSTANNDIIKFRRVIYRAAATASWLFLGSVHTDTKRSLFLYLDSRN